MDQNQVDLSAGLEPAQSSSEQPQIDLSAGMEPVSQGPINPYTKAQSEQEFNTLAAGPMANEPHHEPEFYSSAQFPPPLTPAEQEFNNENPPPSGFHSFDQSPKRPFTPRTTPFKGPAVKRPVTNAESDWQVLHPGPMEMVPGEPFRIANLATPQQNANDVQVEKMPVANALLTTESDYRGMPVLPKSQAEQVDAFREDNKVGPAAILRQGAHEFNVGAGNVAAGLNTNPDANLSPEEAFELGKPLPDYSRRNVADLSQMARGATQMMSGGMKVTTPLIGAGFLQSPFKFAAEYYLGIKAGNGAAYVAKQMGATPDEQEFFHTLGFFLPSTAAAAAGAAGFHPLKPEELHGRVPYPGNPDLTAARVSQKTWLGGRVAVARAETPTASQTRVKVGPYEASFGRGPQSDVQFGDQAPTGLPKPGDQLHQENVRDNVNLAQQASQTNSTAEIQSGLPPEGQPKPKPGEPGSTETPMPQGMEDGALTQQTVDHVGTAIQALPTQLKPKGIMEVVRNLAKWVRTKGTIIGPDNKLSQVTGQSPAAQDQSAQTIATKLVNDQIERQNQMAQQKADEEKERQETAKEEEKAAIEGTTAGAKPSADAAPKVEIPNSPQVQKARVALQGAKKGSTAEELDRLVRSTAMLTTPVRNALVQEEISRRANDKEQQAENVMNGETPAHGLDRQSIQNWADKVAAGEHPYVFVPGKSSFKPTGVDELTATKVKGAANPAFDGTYYHAEDIKPGDIRKAARDKQDPQGALDAIEKTWKEGKGLSEPAQPDLSAGIEPVEEEKKPDAILDENEEPETANEGEREEEKPTVREGKVGDKLAAGETVLTATGRETTPFPKIDTASDRKTQNTVKRVDQWLMDNAIAEAKARGDEFNQRQFEQNRDKPSPADKDSAEMYLFDKDSVQPVPKPFLKPLTEKPTPSVPESTASEKPAEKPAEETAKPEKNEQPAPKVQEQQTFKPGQEVLVKQPDGTEVKRTIRFKHTNGRYVVKGEKKTIPAEQMRAVEEAKPEEKPAPIEQPKQEETAPAPEPVEAKDHGVNGLVNAIYQKLEAGESLGNVTELTRLAEKHMGSSRTSGEWSPKDMFDAMEAAVNRYLIAHGARWMEMDGHEALAELRDLMKRITTQGTRTEEQIKKQQFSTPPTESYVAARAAAVKPSDVMLEPSAGNGGLAAFPKAIGAEVHVNEIAERRQDMLRAAGFGEPTAHNGEILHALLDQKIKPTVIIMNPPFSAGALGGRNRNVYGFNHVEQALQRLQPNGRLVAILGGGQANEPNGGAALFGGQSGEWFKKLGKMYNIRANIRVNGKEYAKYGTAFATRIIVIDKDGPTANLGAVIQRNVDTLEEAYDALQPVIESRPAIEGRTDTGSTEGLTRPEAGNGVARNPQSSGGSGGRAVQPGGSSGATGGTGDAGLAPADDTRDDDTGGRPEPVGERSPVSGSDENQRNEPADSSQGSGGNLHESGRTGEAGRGLAPEEGDLLTYDANGKEKAGLVTKVHPDGSVTVRSSMGADSRVKPNQFRFVQKSKPAETAPEAEIERVDHGERTEQQDASNFVKYKPSIKGAEHPGQIVESKTMATVPLPALNYKPSLPAETLKSKLSAVQLEAVVLVGQANETRLPNGARATCLIGDGTGVGKGREAAGIIFDNWNKGRKRLVWVSQTWDLMQAAIRDLTNVGAEDLAKKMLGLNKLGAADEIQHEGVLYTTYALMRSGDKKGNTRIAQIQKWLRGEDDSEGAHILFDESHNLKNAVVGQGGQASQIGTVTKKLLDDNPNLRMSALSATAASDVMNLGYLDRLGLWGPGTSFPAGFWQFVSEIGGGGLSAMELVARELKAQGRYISRTLSFVGPDGNPVTYETIDVPLTDEQKDVYRTATKAWGIVNKTVDDVIANVTNGSGRQRAMFMSQFYSAQQRFFNILLTTMKIPALVPKIEQDLKDGKSVVVTLVNTNEAAQNREKDRVASDSSADPDEIPDYDFGPATMLINLVHNYFPTQQYADGVSPTGAPIKVPVTDAEGNPVHNPEAVRRRDELEAALKRDLKMPGNPLDILIEALGGPSKVAEMTGRKEYFDEAKGEFVPRGDKGTPRDKVNLGEMAKFQSGKKRIALLSNAAGTGIDLHASLREKNQQKRAHYTLQAGWSADKQMQMFGRTHRTEEASAPEYKLPQTDMGGEKRFIATIAKRLGSLNAISKGQKDAGAAVNVLDKVNFESEQGRQAAMVFYDSLLRGRDVPGAMERIEQEDGSYKMEPIGGREILKRMFVLKQDPVVGETVPEADKTNVTRLLNRLLALDPDYQNAVYNYYYDIFEAIVQRAIEDGTLDTGVKELEGDEHHVTEEKTLSTDPKTGATTTYSKVESQLKNHRMSPEKMEQERNSSSLSQLYIRTNARTGEPDGIVLTKPAPAVVHADGRTTEAVYVYEPGKAKPVKDEQWKYDTHWKTPDQVFNAPLFKANEELAREQRNLDLNQKTLERYKGSSYESYYKGRVEEGEKNVAAYKEKVAELEKESGKALQKATDLWAKQYDATPTHRTEVNHMIGGSVLPWWAAMRETSRGRLDIRTALDAKTGKRVVGVRIPSGEIKKLMNRISGGQSTMTGKTLRDDVLMNGTEYRLESNIRVLRGRIAGHPVVRLVPPSTPVADGLKQLGVLYERGVQPIYYIPDSEHGNRLLDKVLKEYPVQMDDNRGLMSEEGSATIPAPVQAAGEYIGKAAATTLKDAIKAGGMTGRTMKDVGRDLVSWLYPRALMTEQMKDVLGTAIGTPALEEYKARQLTDGIEKMFKQMPEEEWTNFIDRIENGQEQPTEALRDAAELLTSMLDRQNTEEQIAANLGRPRSKRITLPTKANYFPHRYKVRPGQQEDLTEDERLLMMANSRRPLEGSKAFLKQQKLGYREAIEAGAKPLGTPVQMVMKRIQEGSKYVAFRYMMHTGKKAGLITYLKQGQPMPEGWSDVDDRAMQVWRPVETEEDGRFHVKAGRYIWKDDFARGINNYLSRDLIRGTKLGNSLVKLKGLQTEMRLSWSGFHWLNIGFETVSSGLNLGLDKLYNSGIRDLDPEKAVEGLADIGRSILAPITMVREGSRMMDYDKDPDGFLSSERGQEFVEDYPMYPEMQADLFKGGLRVGMPDIYRESLGDGFAKDIQEGHIGKAVLKFFPWASHMLMKPLFETVIPRVKLAFAVQMYAHKLNQYSEALANGEVTRVQLARQVASAVDYRFGELAFDNMYWNNTMRSATQFLFRSASWKGGSWMGAAKAGKEVIEGLKGTASASGFNDHVYDKVEEEEERRWQGARRFTRRLPEMGINTGWLIGMGLTAAAVSSVLSWLATKTPIWKHAEEDHRKNGMSFLGSLLFETMYPRTGRVDAHGEPIRFSFPTGLKDYVHAFHNPTGYVHGSLSDVVANAWDTMNNRKPGPYSNYVYDPNAPVMKQLREGLMYNLEGDFTPMSVSNWRQSYGSKDFASRAERAMGIVGGAPKDYDRSAALNLALELRPAHAPETPDQEEAYRVAHAQPGVADYHHARRTGDRDYLERVFMQLSYPDAMKVMQVATPAERDELQPLLNKKRVNMIRKQSRYGR